MNNFNSVTRVMLIEAGILEFDDDNNEVFLGLTLQETDFMLTCELGATQIDSAEVRLFHELRQKFLAARERALRGAEIIAAGHLERYRRPAIKPDDELE